MKRVAIFVVVLLVLAAAIGGVSYFQFVVKPQMVKGFVAQMKPPPATVSAEPAKQESWVPMLPAIGTFKAVQGVAIAPQIGGIVRRIEFDSGKVVKAGDLLVQIDDAVEQADLVSDKASLKNAELDLDRQRELLRRGNTSKTSFDAALAKRDVAAAALDRTKAVIAQKQIRAPFAGRLGIRQVDLGQYVSPGTALVTLQQLDPIFVDFPIPEQKLARLALGQPVEVKVDAFPGETFRGKVASIDARVSQETRNVLVRAQLDNPDRRLLPGMYANISVLAGEAQDVVTLPRTAISYSLYGDSVYVVSPAESQGEGAQANGGQNAGKSAENGKGEGKLYKVERRFVEIGDTRDDRVAVTKGVKPGEMVVTAGQLKLQPGGTVRIDNERALKAPAERPRT